MAKLEEKLVNIEHKLGGTEKAPKHGDKLGWHLDYIESLIGGGGGGDVELKTINNESLKGTGNIEILGVPASQEGDGGKVLAVKLDRSGFEYISVATPKYVDDTVAAAIGAALEATY